MAEFKDIMLKRRSVYGLGKDTEYTIEEIVDRLRRVQDTVPSAFNSQTSRMVVLSGEMNKKFWELIYDVQKNVLKGEMWDMMGGVIESAKDSFGTVLFFEDRDEVAKMPTQGERTLAYKYTNSGNAQYATWLMLVEMNFGASLQHFNIGYEQGFDKAVRELLDLPDSYEMVAQMPFGSYTGTPEPKDKVANEVRVQLIK